MKNHCEIFAKEAFSKREAWSWLTDEVAKATTQSQVKCTLRFLAKEWQWPKTKVARFLKDITSIKLIEIENNSSSTIIKLIKNNNQKIIPLDIFLMNQDQPLDTEAGTEIGTVNGTAQAQEIQDVEETTGTEIGTANGTNNQKIALSVIKINQFEQMWDNFGTENGTAQTKAEYGVQTIAETDNGTILGQIPDNADFSEAEKEEKKKRTKKRKEENTKEKYSLKGIQKERYKHDQNNSFLLIDPELLSNSGSNEIRLNKKTKRTIEQVEVNDIAFWAENNLPGSMNLEWELAKFQDYYRASHKKMPRDGIAAFRNWLRKATEFKNLKAGENLHEKRKTYQNESYGSRFKENTGFERFLAGGLRAVS
jgi:hypothetical protein